MRIWLACPAFDLHEPSFTWSVMAQISQARDAGIEVLCPNDQPRATFISQARNISAIQALAHHCDAVLYWDVDMDITVESAIQRMVEADKDVVTPLCQSRHTGVITHGCGQEKPDTFGHFGFGDPIPEEALTVPGLYQIGFTGTGILLVRCEVLFAMRKRYLELWKGWFEATKAGALSKVPMWKTPWFETVQAGAWLDTDLCTPYTLGMLENEPETLEELYYTMTPTEIAHAFQAYRTEMNEDNMFSRKCQEIGAEIWLDTTITTRHHGKKVWDSRDLLPGGKDHEAQLAAYEARRSGPVPPLNSLSDTDRPPHSRNTEKPKLRVVLTNTRHDAATVNVALRWAQLVGMENVVVATHDVNSWSARPSLLGIELSAVDGGPNPGYSAPCGTLHGHHANINAGYRFWRDRGGWDYLLFSCGDIFPDDPWPLMKSFIESGRSIGVTACHMTTPLTPRYQDDLFMMTRGGAEWLFPLEVHGTEPYVSELGFGCEVENFASCNIHRFEDMTGNFRFYWFEEYGFRHIGPDTPGVDRAMGRPARRTGV